MRVLLTGAYGQLGRCLLDRVPAEWILLACGSAELDITDRPAVRTGGEEIPSRCDHQCRRVYRGR